VGTIREYMLEVERRNAALSERVMQLEAGLAGEAERNRSVAGVARELRSAMDGMLCTSQVGGQGGQGSWGMNREGGWGVEDTGEWRYRTRKQSARTR
jgi:hypothetical protein